MGIETRIKQFETHTELRFSKVKYRTKRPIEKNWIRRPYTYDQIQKHVQKHTNYGVLCGYGGLIVADADNSTLEETLEHALPTTFSVTTGSGGKHFYYFCPDIEKRIVLENSGVHYGEIQSFGQQVVAPGSIHPNGNQYRVSTDQPIVELSHKTLFSVLQPFQKQKPQQTLTIHPICYPNPSLIQVPITTVIDVREFKRAPNGELYGPNPWHGSSTRMNFWINEQKNVAYCFRHNCGISVPKAIALNEAFVTECDAHLTRAQYSQVMITAKEKYKT